MEENKVHNQPFIISVVCEVYQPEGSDLVHRGLVFKAYQRVENSALLQATQQSRGDAWRVVREPELFMNGPFEQFERRIQELFESSPIGRNASFELKYDEYTDQVRRDYMLLHGFTESNKPWSGLAKHYREGTPVNRKIWHDKYRINAYGNTGFSEYAFKGEENTRLDKGLQGFSPGELKAAERSADILQAIVSGKK